MLIRGEWFVRDDMVPRPIIRARVGGANGVVSIARFLIDTGADCTVFSNSLLTDLGLPVRPPPPGHRLIGIGGAGAFALVSTTIELRHIDGGFARLHGEYAGFSDPAATDMSILGQDVLGIFDVILSMQRNEVLLLSELHQYRVVRV
jgi:hypothetical protein